MARGESRKLAKFVTEEVFGDLEKKMLKLPEDNRVAKLRLTLQPYADRIGSAETRLRRIVNRVGEYEAKWQTALLRRTLPTRINLVSVDPATVKAASDFTIQSQKVKQLFKGIAQDTVKRVVKETRLSVVQGETVAQLTARIRKDALGLTYSQAETLGRTAIATVVNDAREETYLAQGSLVKNVMYVATLDSRTSIICASLDHKVFPPKVGPRPPQHFNCRSTTTPVVASWQELGLPFKDLDAGERASMDGTVPEKTTYPEWLKAQPESVQDKVLGKTRADLFRAGTPIDSFVSKDYEPLTLDQLKKHDPITLNERTQELTTSEKKTVERWTKGGQNQINSWQTHGTNDPTAKKLYDSFTSAMDKLPDFDGTVYRGLSFQSYTDKLRESSQTFIDSLKPGSEISLNKTTSFTKDPRVAATFAEVKQDVKKEQIVFELKTTKGKDISQLAATEYRYQEEIVVDGYQSDAKYKIKSITQRSIPTLNFSTGVPTGKNTLVKVVQLEEVTTAAVDVKTAPLTSIESAKKFVAKQGAATKTEHLAPVTLSGKTFEPVSGTRSQVTLTKELSKALEDPANKIALVHNHPKGQSLSLTDVKTSGLPGADSVVAVAPDGSTYSVKTAGLYNKAKIDEMYDKVYRGVKDKLASSGLKDNDVEALLDHTVMTSLDTWRVVNYTTTLSDARAKLYKKYRKMISDISSQVRPY